METKNNEERLVQDIKGVLELINFELDYPNKNSVHSHQISLHQKVSELRELLIRLDFEYQEE